MFSIKYCLWSCMVSFRPHFFLIKISDEACTNWSTVLNFYCLLCCKIYWDLLNWGVTVILVLSPSMIWHLTSISQRYNYYIIIPTIQLHEIVFKSLYIALFTVPCISKWVANYKTYVLLSIDTPREASKRTWNSGINSYKHTNLVLYTN